MEDDILHFLTEPEQISEIEKNLRKLMGRAFTVARASITEFTEEHYITIGEHSPRVEVKLTFKDNIVNYFAAGTGLLTSTVKVELERDIALEDIKSINEDDFARFIRSKVIDAYNKIPKMSDFKDVAEKHFSNVVPLDNDTVPRTSGIWRDDVAWIHIIYWFYNENFFDFDGSLLAHTIKPFESLLYEDMISITNFVLPSKGKCYVYYGWGRSLILSKDNGNYAQVKKAVTTLEICQFFFLALYVLNFFFSSKVICELSYSKNDNDIKNDKEYLDKEISDIREIKKVLNVATKLLEQYKNIFQIMFVSGKRAHKFESMELSILKKAETEYRLEKLQDDLRQKLEILQKDLSIKEQLLTAEKQLVIVKKHTEMVEKQEGLNRNIFYFTIITLAGVSAQLIGLFPVNKWFPSYEGSEVASEPALFLSSQLVLALAFTFSMVLVVKYFDRIKMKKNNVVAWIRKHSIPITIPFVFGFFITFVLVLFR